MLTRLLSLLLSAPNLIAGHGSMAVPPPRGMHGRPIECFTKKGGKRYCNAGCPEENCLWYQVGCMVGCDDCSLEGKQMWPTPADVQCKRNGSLVPPGKTPFPIPRTVPAEARSWNLKLRSPAGDFTAYMPWASPGASPVADPCGVASGFGASAHTPSYVHAPKGYRVGELGSRVLEPLPTKTVVRAGGTLETGFGVKVNHGGGYSFRLCPAGSPLTEACFQSHPLAFASPNHTVSFVDGSRANLSLPALTVSRGTTPARSQWRRLPFPACNCDLGEGCHAGGGSAGGNGGGGGSSKGNTAGGEGGGSEGDGEGGGGARGGDGGAALLPRRVLREAGGGVVAARLAREDAWAWEAAEEAVAWGAQRAYEQQEDPPPRCPTGTQFAVPADDLYGYGDLPPVLVTDLLRVPAGLQGDFVLSWRWDCEQTDQVWSTCADVTIVA
mmetsp:Transcript_28797/g.92183  ORF Transcript_28797/g.92183 Transcript_28797/m.92183 type:complete len:440 (+) Transcript_28797:59-1378(+)